MRKSLIVRAVPIVALVAAALTVPAATAASVVHATDDCRTAAWVASWAAAPSDSVTLGDPNLNPAFVFGAQSFRMMVTPHQGGSMVRVHLTNRFGNGPVTLNHVTVGNQASGASVQEGSLHDVTFGGRNAVTVPQGEDVVSDPVALAVTAFQPVAISYATPVGTFLPTEHFNANQTSYFSPALSGDHSGDASGSAFSQKITSWYWVDGLDVQAEPGVSTLVNFGDSITDGFVTGTPTMVPASTEQVDANVRYPDFLQKRLTAAGIPLTTVDEGISGNRVLQPGMIPMFGPSALSRITDDAVDVTGVTNAIILEGINDLGQPPWPTAAAMEAGYTSLINTLHAHGIHVLLGTIMPSGSSILDGPPTAPGIEAERQQINAWIRTQHYSDAMVDFDKAMRSPSDPAVLNPAYADGDNLHPNPAGYQAMANAVPLDALTPACTAPTTGSPTGGQGTVGQVVTTVATLAQTRSFGDTDLSLAMVTSGLNALLGLH